MKRIEEVLWQQAEWVDELGTHTGYFTDMRIIHASVPDGWYRYEIRHDDDGLGDWAEIAKHVLVNFWGTLITREPIEFDAYEDGYCWVIDYDYADNEPVAITDIR